MRRSGNPGHPRKPPKCKCFRLFLLKIELREALTVRSRDSPAQTLSVCTAALPPASLPHALTARETASGPALATDSFAPDEPAWQPAAGPFLKPAVRPQSPDRGTAPNRARKARPRRQESLVSPPPQRRVRTAGLPRSRPHSSPRQEIEPRPTSFRTLAVSRPGQPAGPRPRVSALHHHRRATRKRTASRRESEPAHAS